ncbi:MULTISPECIES: asparagine synthase-related protein [unclassified Shewanella]|uniref:asparagine synthase-related protein n=1 Tax=unclassified Shewanella TaxID=196818 RepID=UPI0012FED67C|nr:MULTISPECIES: asparagine synthase-related protein [unclassified Shewanella]
MKLEPLGKAYKYYQTNDIVNRYSKITDLLHPNKENFIQPSSVLSVMMKNYIVGDNTMVDGIRKEPWMHCFDYLKQDFIPCELPSHGKLDKSQSQIACNLKNLLLEEVLSFVDGKNTVGILLSGGMDSRVVAGLLRELQESGAFSGDVVCLTWGVESTRDVVYARRIAKQFSWESLHFPLSAESLIENIHLAADMGAEFSPLHLHAMNSVAKTKGIDGIIAASYGDSVGRAEYSGTKVKDLSGLLSNDFDKFGLISSSVRKQFGVEVQIELQKYHKLFPRQQDWQHFEIERQCHYMRRQLGACMSIIDNSVPLYQIFTKPSVFNYMWSLDPKCRTDYVYVELLKILPGDLLNIPWARDGKIYPGVGNALDNIPSAYNKYGIWLRNECSDIVNTALNSGVLESLNLFNPYSINSLKSYWYKSKSESADRLDERVSWMVSLSIFADKYNIKAEKENNDLGWVDCINSLKGRSYSSVYRFGRSVIK